jgi:hypothetical protein
VSSLTGSFDSSGLSSESPSSQSSSTPSTAPLFSPQPGKQTQAYESEADILGYGGAAGGGKALSLDTRIPTPDGWTTMGEIDVGDVVLDERGRPCNVVAVTDVMRDHRVYAVRFDDGTEILADAEHQWLTQTYAERLAALRRTDEFRARRRESRASRVTGRRSAAFTATISERNATRTYDYLPAPTGSIKTTEEIRSTLMARGGSHVNHAVALAAPLDLPDADLPIPPYTLGAWLGDGTSLGGSVTCADEGILEAIRADGYEITKRSARYLYGILGLQAQLRRADLLGEKRIPTQYLRASVDQRLALLQGIVDTDGHVSERGAVEISLTNERLMRDVWRLVMTLGIRATVTEGRATIDGRDCGPKWRIKFMTALPAARLSRKAGRLKAPTRGVHRWRYIVAVDPVPSVPVRCIQVDSPSHLYLASEALVPTHNSMVAIGLAVTRHRRSIIFRREQDQVRDLWDKLGTICGPHGRSNENLLVWRDLPGDRTVRLAGVKNERDWKKYQGHENDLHAFDEATEFSEAQVRTLIAWNRTRIPGQRCRVVLGFNPPTTPEGQWIIDFFGPWLDPQHPDPAEPGELRWFAVVDGKDVPRPDGEPFEHGGETITPLSRTFIPARLEDNPILEATGYRKTLQNVPEPLRSQLLYGDFQVGLTDDEWQVIPTAWVRAAQARWHKDGAKGHKVTALGIDLAQGGADSTVIARRYGTWVAPLEVHPGASVPDANVNAAHVLKALTEGGTAYIDADGIGASTYFLVRAKVGEAVQSYLGSAGSDEHDESGLLGFNRKRSEAWWRFRCMLDPAKNPSVALPPDRRILTELCGPRYTIENGEIRVERKPDVIKRVGWSPDYADAIIMSFEAPSYGARLADAYRRAQQDRGAA